MLLKELSRAVFNRRMGLVMGVMLILLYLSSYQSHLNSHFFIDRNAADLTPEGLNEILEIGGNTYLIWISAFYYTQVIFVLASIYPYAASFVYERKMRFHYFSIIRIGHLKYRLYKLFANGITGGVALSVPSAIYFVGLSIFFENTILHPFDFQPEGLFSSLFTNTPMLYILLVISIHFIFGFSIAIFAMGITSFCSKIVYVYAIPFALYLSLDIIISNINGLEKYAATRIYYLMSNVDLKISDLLIVNFILILSGLLMFYINYKQELKNGS
ncbi:hypothetical protein CD30_02060 [Ureibacillus massiliensis 4400831 = CIP 108448 = CCUG 49529]|uniref:Uncharacterized protein n=1 Tax=Ureibacillus massiliensis 4400831 = CIP 108448 = CCUG 49529 TaxID=1211035 RepID=A0A0A3JAA7_9BACL|nr:hypothetical protein [Ureibacillus massiliensis]KGR92133.1 hypothetical protein CD30_02060 [Ureibacillus massiliensis 4400831 = CIP 108448 = CCUG 49529]